MREECAIAAISNASYSWPSPSLQHSSLISEDDEYEKEDDVDALNEICGHDNNFDYRKQEEHEN
jgi:hypothetical protein